jgi:hypothetical protein
VALGDVDICWALERARDEARSLLCREETRLCAHPEKGVAHGVVSGGDRAQHWAHVRVVEKRIEACPAQRARNPVAAKELARDQGWVEWDAEPPA